jgi:CMP-N-acetylneuraminic acid synthetase
MDHFLGPEIHRTRSQDLPTYYRLNGAVYICQTKRFLEERSFFLAQGCKAVLMPKERSVDIDTQYDFRLAEFLYHEANPTTNLGLAPKRDL